MIYAIIIQNRDELSVKRSSVHKFSDNLTFKFVRDSGYEDYKLRVYVKKKENEYMLEVKNEDTFVVDSRFLSETGWLSLSFALVKDEEINHLGIAKINVKDSFGNESTVLPEEKVIWQKYVDQEISKVTDPIIKDVNDSKNEVSSNLKKVEDIKASMDELKQNVDTSKNEIDKKYEEIKKIAVDGGNGGTNITIDDALSATSKNPVENRIIKNELDKKAAKNEIPTNLSSLNEDETHQTVTADEKKKWDSKSDFDGDFNSLKNIPKIPDAVAVDSSLSSTSTNPVQNKIIKAELDKKAEKNEIPTNLSSLNEDEAHQTVTAEEKKKWDSKSDFDGDFNSLNNIPNIPDAVIVDADLSETSTNAIQNQAVAKGLAQKANSTDLGINKYSKSETDATVVLENGSWTVFPTMSNLNISMGTVDENKAFICGFQFTSGDTATSLTLNNCTLTSNSDTVESNKTYEVNILDGSAIVREI